MNRFNSHWAFKLVMFLSLCAGGSNAEANVPHVQANVTPGNVGSSMRVVSSGLCMSVSEHGRGIWRVVQQPCRSEEAMWFYARPVSNTQFFTIEARRRCLDVPSGSRTSGERLQLYACNGQTNQHFELRATGAGSYKIHPRLAPTLCLDIEEGDTQAGRRLQQFACHNGNNQRFLIRPTLLTEIFDFDRRDVLHIGWPNILVPDPYNHPLFDRVNNGTVVHFAAAHVRWSDRPGRGQNWWDDEKICPRGTSTIEISRLERDRNTFRIRCYQ